jgi:ATP-dependent DNA ligase
LIDEAGEPQFFGKKKSYRKNRMAYLTNLTKEIKSYNLPKNSLFDGYITFENDQKKAFRFIKSIYTDEDNFRRQFEFYFTDVIYLNNEAMFNSPLVARLQVLKNLFSTETRRVKLQKGYIVNKKEVYSQLKHEYKIFMFKDLDSVYSFKQSSYWRILKVPQTFYMVIMGFVESQEEKFRGMVMALEGGLYKNGVLSKVMNIPVHSNENRSYLYHKKSEILGKVFEFLALDKTDKGKFDEARFVGIRDDMKSESCIEIEEDTCINIRNVIRNTDVEEENV